jgi:RND family efflux transporter MFP subunit
MKVIRFILPILVVALGIAGSALLVKHGPRTEPEAIPFVPPLVETATAAFQDYQFKIHAHGSVSARTEIDLVPEVSGKVARVSDSLTAGGFFEKGDELVTIESRDFELGMIGAKSQLAQASAALAREEAEASVALKEWKQLGAGEASPLLKREPQLAQAHAAVRAAEAALEQSERDLARCVLRAPFAGRVELRSVAAGQFVNRGAPVARLYAVDFAEVRLPLPAEELAFLDLPLEFRGESKRASEPTVTLRAKFAGKQHEWQGRIVRTEGRIDTRNRMIYAVVQIDDPYGRSGASDRPPLAVGLFVECEIEGKTVKNSVVLPRRALRNKDELWVIDNEKRLNIRRVEVLRAGRDEVIVGSGLDAGDLVCVSSLDAVVNGMSTRLAGDEPAKTSGGAQ